MRYWACGFAPLAFICVCTATAPRAIAQTQAIDCPPEPTPVDLAQVKEWIDAARDTLRAGRASDALALFDKAHRLVPTSTAGQEFVTLAIRLDRSNEARKIVLELRDCGNVSEPRISAWLNQIEARRNPLEPPPRPPPPMPLPERHPMPPSDDGPSEPLCPEDPASGLAFSTGWEAWLANADDGNSRFGQALRSSTMYSKPCGEILELRFGLTVPFALTHAGFLVAPGVSGDVGLYPAGPLRVSLGTNLGALLVDESAPEPIERNPETGLYVEPTLLMSVRVADHVEVGSHVGILFANTRSATESKFRMGFVTLGVWAGFTLSPRCISRTGERQPC